MKWIAVSSIVRSLFQVNTYQQRLKLFSPSDQKPSDQKVQPSGYSSSQQSRHSIAVLLLMSGTVAIGFIAVVSYQVVRGLILNNLMQQALLEVQHGGDEIDQWLVTRKTEVRMLAHNPTIQTVDWSVVGPYLRSEQSWLPEFNTLLLANADGMASNMQTDQMDTDVSDRPWFKQTMTGEIAVSDPLIGRTTGHFIFIVSAPITGSEDAQPRGAVGGTVKIDRFLQIISTLQQEPDSYAFALNSQGVPIAHPNPAMIGAPEKPAPSLLESSNPDLAIIAHRMKSQQSGIELAQIDDKWQYVAYVPLQEANWSLALVIPEHNLESRLGALNLLASVLGGLLIIALIGSWRHVQAFEQTRTRAAQEALLNRLTTRIRESLDLQTILQTTVSELATLAQLDRMLFAWYDEQTQIFEVVCECPDQNQGNQYQFEGDCPLVACFQQTERVQFCPIDAPTQPALTLPTGAYVAFPLPSQDGRAGYLIGSYSHPLNQDEQELLQAVADQLAIAITQAHLYTQAQTQVTLLNDALTRLKQAQLRLVQSEKMSSLGQLIAGIAHEINNPVNFIHGNLLHASQYTQDLLELIALYQKHCPDPTQILRDKTEDIDLEFLSTDLPKLLVSMQVGAERIREIVRSLRVFSRLDEAEVKDVDIHEGIDSTLMILQNRLKAKPGHPEIEVVKHYGKLPLVECYAGQLNQVFMNIISNGIDALEEYREQKIGEADSNEKMQPSRITIKTSVEEKYVRVLIADNGPGISSEVQSRLFDPFFTTKPVGRGTGMGLAISYQIIAERHKGQLRCNSTPGQGTEFVIEIPICQIAV
jgi:two-component system, NtrC family, sensor kinase